MSRASELANAINTAFQKPVIKVGSELKPIAHWSTGILPMDVILDGGMPQGRFIDVFGDYSTLKSYLAYCTIAAVQAKGGTTALVDSEHAADDVWMRGIGCDMDSLLLMRPETGEDAIGVMEVLIRDGIDLIVWDSIAATQPSQYATKRPGDDDQPGGLARMMSAALRRLTSVNEQSAVMCLNQTRVNVGMTYGSKDTTPGGRSLPFYASYRLKMNKAGRKYRPIQQWTGEKMEEGKELVKQTIKCTMEKNKLKAPVREVYFDFDLETGQIDELGFILAWLLEQGYVEVKGSWWVMDDLKAQGYGNFYEALGEQEDVLQWVRDELTKDHVMASPGSPSPQGKIKVAKPKRKNSKSEE